MANEPVVTIVGNLVADPEPRVSQAGKSWVTFRIANTPRVKNRQSGEFEDGEALWVGCRAFGELADNIAQSLSKGVRVIVQGRLSQESYEKDGQKRTSLSLDVDAVGPELRFATATVVKTPSRGSSGGFGQSAPSALAGGAGGFDDEQPF